MTNNLFYVVEGIETNSEIFKSLQEAKDFMSTIPAQDLPRITLCKVNHAFQERNGSWNYNDYLDTFEEVHAIEV